MICYFSHYNNIMKKLYDYEVMIEGWKIWKKKVCKIYTPTLLTV